MPLADLPQRWRQRITVRGGWSGWLCWEWSGWNSGNGYGKTKVAGRAQMAHRAIWEYLIGPVPPGLLLDHKCRNRCCCNPRHLEPVTPRENTSRGQAKLFEASGHPGLGAQS